MSESPVTKKLKIEESEVTNGETITTNGTADISVDKKENNSNNHQTEAQVEEKKEETLPNNTTTTTTTAHLHNSNSETTLFSQNNTPPPPPLSQPTTTTTTASSAAPPVPVPAAAAAASSPAPPPPQATTTSQATSQATSQVNRLDPNEIIAQLKESLRQEEAKLQFLRKLKLTQAKLKERQERIAAQNQTKEESKESTTSSSAPSVAATTLPPPPPLLKTAEQVAAARCTNSPKSTKPFSVIVSNSQTIKPKPDTSSLVNSLQSLSSISAPAVQTSNMHRAAGVSSIQPNRAAMAKILEEMILQQPSPKPKVLQWPICPNINDQEYLHYTGLEFIVDRLKNPTRADIATPSLEITCVVCGLDFSPEWEKTDFEDKFECYYCFTSKLRKQVREEHTERLKQGFIKVVQKEKEFERQLQNQQREEQLMQQKLAEQQRQQQQQIMEQQQRTLQLQLQQQTLEQLQRQQIANQLLQHLQKSRQQPGSTNSALNTLLQFTQDPTNQLLAQLTKRGQQTGNALNLLQVPSEETLKSLHVQLRALHHMSLHNHKTLGNILHHYHITSRLNKVTSLDLLKKIKLVTAELNKNLHRSACSNRGDKNGSKSQRASHASKKMCTHRKPRLRLLPKPKNSSSSNPDADKNPGDHGGQSGQLREYLLDLLPRLPTQ